MYAPRLYPVAISIDARSHAKMATYAGPTPEIMAAAPKVTLKPDPLKPNARIVGKNPLRIVRMTDQERSKFEYPEYEPNKALRENNVFFDTNDPSLFNECEVVDAQSVIHRHVAADGSIHAVYMLERMDTPGGYSPVSVVDNLPEAGLAPCAALVQATAEQPRAVDVLQSNERQDGAGGMWSIGAGVSIGGRAVIERPASRELPASSVKDGFEALFDMLSLLQPLSEPSVLQQAPTCAVEKGPRATYLRAGQCTAAIRREDGEREPFFNAPHLDAMDFKPYGAMWHGVGGKIYFIFPIHRLVVIIRHCSGMRWDGAALMHCTGIAHNNAGCDPDTTLHTHSHLLTPPCAGAPKTGDAPLGSLFCSLSKRMYQLDALHRASRKAKTARGSKPPTFQKDQRVYVCNMKPVVSKTL